MSGRCYYFHPYPVKAGISYSICTRQYPRLKRVFTKGVQTFSHLCAEKLAS